MPTARKQSRKSKGAALYAPVKSVVEVHDMLAGVKMRYAPRFSVLQHLAIILSCEVRRRRAYQLNMRRRMPKRPRPVFNALSRENVKSPGREGEIAAHAEALSMASCGRANAENRHQALC